MALSKCSGHGMSAGDIGSVGDGAAGVLSGGVIYLLVEVVTF